MINRSASIMDIKSVLIGLSKPFRDAFFCLWGISMRCVAAN
ncbi:hypothetical protein HMPREF1141_2334 [Clostridium sp. MSTE9]|nr:hypothetical protein HMPREF1141_2334 [Clostridium sp. MSTE9]